MNLTMLFAIIGCASLVAVGFMIAELKKKYDIGKDEEDAKSEVEKFRRKVSVIFNKEKSEADAKKNSIGNADSDRSKFDAAVDIMCHK